MTRLTLVLDVPELERVVERFVDRIYRPEERLDELEMRVKLMVKMAREEALERDARG